MGGRSAFVQIRVTPGEKAALKRLAAAAGRDLSSYILSRALPSGRLRFEEILRQLESEEYRRFALAELNDFLADLASVEMADAVQGADPSRLSPFASNYVAAMVEHASQLKGLEPPPWTRSVRPLERPWFASPLEGHRLHLLRSSPVPFKRRNLFVDSSVGSRV